MAAVLYMLTALHIAIGVLPEIHAFNARQWQCKRDIHMGKVTACKFLCFMPFAMEHQHFVLLNELDGTPCMHGYCYNGQCVRGDIHHSLKRTKRSVRSFAAGYVLGRSVGRAQGRRLGRRRGLLGRR
nr:uncharacterized protein LOC126524500 [Dermacentor andersoni]